MKKKITNKSHYKYNTSCGKMVSSKFKLGDIVRLVNPGDIYSTYKEAFKYFNILQNAVKSECFYHLEYKDGMKETNWVILGIASHESDTSTLLYHIANTKREHLVIGKHGITLHRRPLDVKGINEKYIINQL